MKSQPTKDQLIDAIAHTAVRTILRRIRPKPVAKVAEMVRNHGLSAIWDGRWSCYCGEIFPNQYEASEHTAREILS